MIIIMHFTKTMTSNEIWILIPLIKCKSFSFIFPHHSSMLKLSSKFQSSGATPIYACIIFVVYVSRQWYSTISNQYALYHQNQFKFSYLIFIISVTHHLIALSCIILYILILSQSSNVVTNCWLNSSQW